MAGRLQGRVILSERVERKAKRILFKMFLCSSVLPSLPHRWGQGVGGEDVSCVGRDSANGNLEVDALIQGNMAGQCRRNILFIAWSENKSLVLRETDEIMEDINRLKVVLVEKKRTNKWLAEQLGVNPSTVSKWCTNSSQPDLCSLLKIADLLEVDIKELIIREYKSLQMSR